MGRTGLRCAAKLSTCPDSATRRCLAGGDLSIDALAVAVSDLIEQRGYWPVHLVGNSLGGAVCVRVAARRPDLVRSLTLISPALPDLRPRLIPLRVTVASAPWLGPGC